MTPTTKAPQWATCEAALMALAHGSPVEVLVTMNGETIPFRGYVSSSQLWYKLRPSLDSPGCLLLSPFDIARIDYADAGKRATSAPFWVREVGE